MHPTVPINHNLSCRNQQNRTEVYLIIPCPCKAHAVPTTAQGWARCKPRARTGHPQQKSSYELFNRNNFIIHEGFLSHGSTPSHHPFFDLDFHKKHPAIKAIWKFLGECPSSKHGISHGGMMNQEFFTLFSWPKMTQKTKRVVQKSSARCLILNRHQQKCNSIIYS